MLICPKCNHDNELGRIFCFGCGDRLDLSSIKPPTAEEKKRRKIKRGVINTVRLALNGIVAGALILVITLICLAPEVPPVEPTKQEFIASDVRRTALEKLVNGRKAGQVVVTPGQLNAFLKAKEFQEATGAGIKLTPIALRASFSDSRIKIEFLGTAHFSTYFKKTLYLGYRGQPTVVNGKFVFKPTGGWLGRLPIHPLLLTATSYFESRFSQLLGDLGDEKALLDKLTSIDVTKDSTTLVRSITPAP